MPVYTHTPEAGNIYGLAKFNVLSLSKKDTISKPSKLSEVLTFSSEGRINASGDTPFHELSMLGSDSQMRGYYKGAYRDNVLVDSQIEYRAPIWNIFGATGWIGTGRVASNYKDLSLNGWKLNYGAGLRIRVDTEHNTNLRIDYGFGPNGVSGLYFAFAEAF